MSEAIKKVLANCQQSFSDQEKGQARNNIGALGGVKVQTPTGTSELVPDSEGKVTVDLTHAQEQVQANWAETDISDPSYIQNKPNLDLLATKAELSSGLAGKQDTLTAGSNISIVGNVISASAAPQQQADWSQDDSSAVDFIKNKPANLVQDADYVHTDNNFTDADKSKLGSIQQGAEVNVQADWNQSDASADDYIKNKPSIPAPQVQSNWAETSTSDPAYIRNKPNLATVATSGSYNDLSDKPDIPSQQVQSDWTEEDDSDPSFILHKPTLATVATSGSYNDLTDKPTIPAAQVQSDWAQADSSAVDFIKNKPAAMETKPLVAGTNIEFVQGNDATVTINSTATKVTKTSSPYTTPVDLTGMTIHDPGEDFGSLVRDQANNTLGYLAPKHYGNVDEGKVLTIVNAEGYKMKWAAPSGGASDLKVLAMDTRPLTSYDPVTLAIADGHAYTLEMQDSLSARITLSTNSPDEIHSLIYVKNQGGANCGTVTLVWRDAALEEHTAALDMSESEFTYCFDVRIRKVHVNNADYSIAAVHDYPVAYRHALDTFSISNETTRMVGVWR